VKNWTVFEKIWLGLFTAVGVYLSVSWGESLIGLVTFLTGIMCVVLVAKGSIYNYAFGLVNVLGYAYLSYNNKLYGEVMLNMLYFLPVQFIGYWMWSKAINKETGEVIKRRFTRLQTLLTILVTLCAVHVYQYLLAYLGGNLTLLDATSTVVSVIATILMLFRYREQWLLWIVVNIVSIAMWVLSGGTLMALMWAAYLINACYGYYKWSKD
jgi:nicotinamide mononucleotide transporter